MNFTELMSILNGEYKETAGTDAQNQCVDLANAYIKYVLGLPVIEWTNAVDFPSKAGDKYDWIPNTPTGVPQEGDLVIWGGTYGHIAIFIEGNANRFTSFDENYPTGSPCHVQEHTYLSPKVIGWLHPKVQPLDYEQLFNAKRIECDLHWNDLNSIKDALVITGDYILKTVLDRIDSLVSTEREYGKQQEILKKANEKILELEKTIDTLGPKHEEIAAEVTTQGQTLNDVKNSVQEVKDSIAKPDWGALKLIWEGIKKLFHF